MSIGEITNPKLRTLKTGDISGGNYFEVEADGTDVRHGNATVWEDMRFPFFGRRLDITSGHLDYDTGELGVNFDDTSRYDDLDMIGIISQLEHKWKIGSSLKPHVHWIQNQDAVPNALLKYRIYANSELPGLWQLVIPTGLAFPYLQNALQISVFPEIDMSSITGVSAFIDIKLFRDTANLSGLFAGADPYIGNVLMKEFDFHFEINTIGSRQEYIK